MTMKTGLMVVLKDEVVFAIEKATSLFFISDGYFFRFVLFEINVLLFLFQLK